MFCDVSSERGQDWSEVFGVVGVDVGGERCRVTGSDGSIHACPLWIRTLAFHVLTSLIVLEGLCPHANTRLAEALLNNKPCVLMDNVTF